MVRKKHKKRRPRKVEFPNKLMKFVPVIVIIALAVALGYGTTRFAIAPMLGYDLTNMKLSPIKESKTSEKVQTGYALQYGCFSKEYKAKLVAEKLLGYGYETKVEKTANGYRIIGETVKSKEEALKQLNDIDKTKDIDVFITKITKG